MRAIPVNRGWRAGLGVLVICLAGPSLSAEANLSWTPPTQNTDGTPLNDLAGFRLYAGCNESGSYELVPAVINDPAVTSYVYEGLPNGATCFFAATAVNSSGVESVYSNEATKIFPAIDEPIPGPVENLNVTWSEPVMAITIVQSTIDASTAGNEDADITFGSASEVGNSLLFLIRWRTPAQATAIASLTITDESNATVALTQAPIHTSGLNGASHAWAYLSNITTASIKTMTVTLDGSPTTGFFSAWELAGADTSDLIGATLATEGDSTQVAGTIVTTADNSAVFAAYGNNSGNQTAQSGWTDIAFANLSWFSDGAYNLDVGTAGNISIDPASTNSPTDWGLTAVEVKPAAGGGSTVQAVDNRLQSQLYKQFLIR